MNLDLKNKEWKEFLICDEFDVKNSKAYHKTNLKETVRNGISYVTRTNLNNGVESIVKKQDFKINKPNTIAFGAENATFFYQPNEYITGNKMYFIQNQRINRHSGLFLQLAINKSIENCGFGYGKGLTGTRVQKRYISLPVNEKGEPDFEFMEAFMKQKEQEKFQEYNEYISIRIKDLKDFKTVEPIEEKKWAEFFLKDIFKEIQRGKRLKKADHQKGKMPYVSSTGSNNGVDGYVGNKEKVRIFSNCLTIANSGSVGACFYQPFKFVASDHVTKLKNDNFNEYTYKFISSLVSRLGIKYSFNREMNDTRIKKEKILLPVNDQNQPDYDYMENYMKQLEYKKLNEYLRKKEKLNANATATHIAKPLKPAARAKACQ